MRSDCFALWLRLQDQVRTLHEILRVPRPDDAEPDVALEGWIAGAGLRKSLSSP